MAKSLLLLVVLDLVVLFTSLFVTVVPDAREGFERFQWGCLALGVVITALLAASTFKSRRSWRTE